MKFSIDRDRLEVSVAAIIRQHGGRGLDPDMAAAEIGKLIEKHGVMFEGKRNRREAGRLIPAQTVETAHPRCSAKEANGKRP